MASYQDVQYTEAVEKLTALTADIEKFVKAGPDEFVNTDVGPIKTLSGIEEELFKTRGLVECVSFDTKALLDASTLPVESLGRVTADPDQTLNGTYIRKSLGWRFYEWIDLADMLPKPDTQNNSVFFLNPTNLVSSNNIVYTHRFDISPIKVKFANLKFTITAWTNSPRVDTGFVGINHVVHVSAVSGDTNKMQGTITDVMNCVSSVTTTEIPTFDYVIEESVEGSQNVMKFRLLPITTPQAENLYGKVEVELEFYENQLV